MKRFAMPGLSWKPLLLIGLVFVVIMTGTHLDNFGDTGVYADDIARFAQHRYESGQNPLWEFGHVLWRPAGYITWKIFEPILKTEYGDSVVLQITAALVGINLVASLVCMLLVYLLALQFSGRTWVSAGLACVFLCMNAIIDCGQAGLGYVPGVALRLAACILLVKEARSSGSSNFRRPVMAGVLLGLAAAFWLPYVLGSLGVLSILVFCGPDDHRFNRTKMLAATITAVSAGIVLTLAYALGVSGRQIGSVGAFREWATAASHGIIQNRTAMRIATGLPRTILYLGDYGLTVKRFVFGDPYAKVTVMDVLGGVWKLVLVYLGLAALLWKLWSSGKAGRNLTFLLASFSCPVLFFAMFIFEPGAPERYLPAYAGLFIAFAFVLGRYSRASIPDNIVVALLVTIVTWNVYCYSSAYRSPDRHDIARISELRRIMAQEPPSSIAFLVSPRDGINVFYCRFPFHPAARLERPAMSTITGWAGQSAGRWRKDFAAATMAVWERGGSVWLSNRVLASWPKAEWEWVEGDDKEMKWAQIAGFFSQLQTSPRLDEDGFVRLEPTEPNRRILEASMPKKSASSTLGLGAQGAAALAHP